MTAIEEYLCSHCDVKFTHSSDKRAPRCPTCLRSQGIIPVSAAAAERIGLPKQRMVLLLTVALLLIGGVATLFVMLRGRSAPDTAPPKGLRAQLEARGVTLSDSEWDFRVSKSVAREAFDITGEKSPRAKAEAIAAKLADWVTGKTITLSDGQDAPLPMPAGMFLAALKQKNLPAGSYQLAVTALALMRGAGLTATLAEHGDVKNAVSVIGRKRFGVIVSLGKSRLWIDPWRKQKGEVPKSVKPLTDLQVVALGLAYRAVALVRQTDASTKASRMRKATASIERALKLWPASPSVRFARGQIHLMSGMVQLGISDFTMALRSAEDALGRYNLGVALMQQDRHQEGLAQLKRALALDPKLLPAYIALARARLQSFAVIKTDERTAMVDDVDQLLKKAESLAKQPVADLFFLRGQVSLLKKDASGAVNYFRKEIAAFPKHDQAYFALAQFYLRAEKYKDGATLVGKLVAHAPKNPRARVLWAQFLQRAGELEQARKQYQQAITLNPKLPNLRLALAQLYLEQKQSSLAITTAKAEIAAFPNNVSARIFLAVIYRAQGKLDASARVMADALKRSNRKKALKQAFEAAFKRVDAKRTAVTKTPAPKSPAPTPSSPKPDKPVPPTPSSPKPDKPVPPTPAPSPKSKAP